MRLILKVRAHFFLFIILILNLSHSFVFAQEATKEIAEKEAVIRRSFFMASAGQERVLKVGLVDCLAFVLKNNSEVKIKKIEPLIWANEVKVKEAVFEPELNIEASVEDTKEQSSSSGAFSSSVSTSYTDKINIGLEGKFPIGTEYEINFDNKKYKSNAPFQVINPYYKSEATITITQPLLKDFGTFINRADIFIAQNNLKKSNQDVQSELIRAVSEVKKSYYDYVFYLEQYKTAELSLKKAQNLLNIIQKRYNDGLASSVELLEAQSGTARGEDELLAVEQSLKLAEDNLKYITNLINDPELWNAKIEPLDTPKFEITPVNLVESLKQAFDYRPDYNMSKIDLINQDIQIKLKDNALLPEIDLVGSFGLNGLNKDYFDALSDGLKGEYRDWSIGLEVNLPLGNKEAKAELEKTKLTKAKLLLSFERLQQNIIFEVREAARKANLLQRKVLTSLKVKETEEARYLAAEERFSQGLVNTHDMIEYQEDLFKAQTDYLKSLIDYYASLITLDQKTGITLAKSDIKFE